MENAKYKTGQRKEILEYIINNSSDFFSAEELEENLKKNNINVGLTTIYRYLKLLEKQGKIRIDYKNNTKYYQYIMDECATHYHLKCRKCGKIIHFECKDFEAMIRHISNEHGFCIDPESIIYGICKECMN